MTRPDTEEQIAGTLFGMLGTGTQRDDIAVADMAAARRIAARVRALREARGERVVGRKIGFSNRAIWPVYGVDGPMWNYVWNTTLHEAPSGEARIALAGMPEPRVEPEIVLHLARAPEPGMDEAALLGCIDRVAHGFEVVQSVFPGWKLTAPGAAAAFGLHGALVVGPWREIGADRAGWGARLADFSLTLRRDGTAVETGHASIVLGGPVSALRFLVETIGDGPERLRAGEIVTTGTLTDAQPLRPSEVWSTTLDGIDLPGLRLAV